MDQLDIPHDQDQEITDNLFVPDINSNDPEERKLARKIRIEKRVEVLARQRKSKDPFAPDRHTDKVTLLQIQLEKSSDILKALFQEAEQQVTNVRVANDVREMDRREADGVAHQDLMAQLHEDAILSMQIFEEIAGKWSSILRYNDPLHIHDELQTQREKCDELVKQKDEVIAMLKQEVRNAEARFYLDQHSQNEDIRMLAKRVEKQVTIMRAAHAVELQHIEDIMIQERANMMELNDKRWNEMYKRREEQELAISENKLKQRQEFEEVVARVRTKHYEKIREVKISLERNCDQLQQEFEYVKACAMSNSEKMDYNYQILRKREDENIIIKSNQKRLLNKLQDTINVLRRKIKEFEVVSNAQISKLCGEIMALQKCIKTEKTKSKAVSYSNDKKYQEIWELNRKIATKLLEKIMIIDRVLCKQHLGIPWQEPHIKLLTKEKLPSYRAALKICDVRHGKPHAKHPKKRKKNVKIVTKAHSNPADFEYNIGYRRLLRTILERVADKSGFLIESKMKEIIGTTSFEEGVLVKVDNVFDALGMGHFRDVNIMMHFFRPYIYCPLCRGGGRKGGVYDYLDIGTSNSSSTVMVHGDAGGPDGAMSGTGMALEHGFALRDSDGAIDNIVASIVDPKRLKDSSSNLDLIHKQGECIGPAKGQDGDRRIAQIADYATIMGDRVSASCLVGHPLYMNPASVLRALREFVNKAMCKVEEKEAVVSSDHDLSKTTQTISRLMNQKDVKDYWDRFKSSLAARTAELWKGLYFAMKKYHGILEERNRLNEDLKCLVKQNRELKHMLKRFQVGEMKKSACAVEQKSYKVLQEEDFPSCK